MTPSKPLPERIRRSALVAPRRRRLRQLELLVVLLVFLVVVASACRGVAAAFARLRRRRAGPKSSRSRCFFGSFANGSIGIDAVGLARASRSLPCTSLRSPRAHGAIAPPSSDFAVVGHDQARIEVVGRAEPLAVRARAVRRVERERARRHLRHRDAADHAGQPAREQLIAALERVDDDDVVGERERRPRATRPGGARCPT